MSINEIKVPFISYDEIRVISEDFLHRHNTTDEIPVPIDEIGHIVLHKPIFEQLDFTNEEEWKYMITAFDTKQYGNLETQANKFAALILVPRYHLIEKYNDAINKVEQEGFDRKENSELFNEYVCRWLGQIFKVSSKTIEYRLKADRLI